MRFFSFLVILRAILLRGGACWFQSSVVTTLSPQSLLKELDQDRSWFWGVAHSSVHFWGGNWCFFFYRKQYKYIRGNLYSFLFHFIFLLLCTSPLFGDLISIPSRFFLGAFQNMNKLYVGNLSPSVTVEDLKQCFGENNLPVPDQVLLKSGYAFVDFPDQNSAIKAIESLSGKCGFDK